MSVTCTAGIPMICNYPAQYKPQQMIVTPDKPPMPEGFIVDPANKPMARIWRSSDTPREDNVVAEVPAQCLSSYDLLMWCVERYEVAK